MRIILQLTALTIMKDCGMTSTENHFEVSVPQRYFFGATETLKKKLAPAKQQENIINQMLEEIAGKSSYYEGNLNKSESKLNPGRGDEERLFQSDITLAGKQTEKIVKEVVTGPRYKRQMIKDYANLSTTWDGTVFYTWKTSDRVVKKAFKMGAKVWSDATCIDFVENENARDKVVVVNEPGCWSSVGRVGGDQFLSIREHPTEGSAVHEIGHVLGLFHTMQRHDRDDFIKVVMENVDPLCIKEFEKVMVSYIDVYGLTYDYGSVMHYSDLRYSRNNRPTMITIDPNHQRTMGSELISFSDIFMVNEHYGCNKKCNNRTSVKCENEGFPHPRNCSTCICPSGYGGALCDRRPPGCGEDLVATSEKQLLIGKLGRGSALRDQFDFCNYMITAPEEKNIEVQIQSFSRGYDVSGCPVGGVEIKSQKDQKLTGYRFCSISNSEDTIVSHSNRLPVILFSRLGTLKATITYRYID